MPELRHKVTGVLVSVSDEKAARLGSEWVPEVVKKATPAPATRRRKAATPAADADD